MTPDDTGLDGEQVAALKWAFRELDCAIADLNEASFEISHEEYPIATHVCPTAYFLQFSTVMIARPKGFPFRTRTKLHAFLNRANTNTKVAKFTLEGDKPSSEFGGWMIMASARFVRGVMGGDWDPSALNNCLLLWLQDIAEFMLLPAPFGFVTMKREKPQ
jgi:hypothetical protein